jgi:hypothetical protein
MMCSFVNDIPDYGLRGCDMSKKRHKIKNGYLWLHVKVDGLNTYYYTEYGLS